MPSPFHPWRVAVTREEQSDGPLSSALRAEGLTPLACPVLVEAPPMDEAALNAAAAALDDLDWVVAASARAVRALTRARGGPWPAALRTAAVGAATARAMAAAGVAVPPVVGAGDGADALWAVLATAASWREARVLVPTTPGGRTELADRLRAAGARVTVVDAYRMQPRPADAIAADWDRAAPDAVVVASSRTAETLVDAIGGATLAALPVVAIGAPTAATLARHGVPCDCPDRAGFADVARLLAARHAMVTPA